MEGSKFQLWRRFVSPRSSGLQVPHLLDLLGTVTGLVQVFSQMPAGGTVDKSLFSQGISLALLTTIARIMP